MTRRLEPQDLYAIKLVEDPQITPDGERIAYLVAEIDRESYEYHRSIWVADVDEVYRHCLAQGLDVTWPPTDHPWNVREMHVRHPDGHVFRLSQARG